MDDRNFKLKKLAYIIVGILLGLAGILLLIYGLVTMQYNGKAFLIIGIILIVLVIPYSIFASFMRYSLDNSYKEIVLEELFRVKKLEFHSKQMGIKNNIYEVTKEEFDNLKYINVNPLHNYEKNNLVLGTIRDVQFKSMDYEYLTDKGNVFSNGRVYVFNMREDKDFKLYITKDIRNDNLKSFDLPGLKYNLYTTDVEKAKKIIKLDKFIQALERLETYGKNTYIINNGCLYLIIDGIKDSFSLVKNKTYFQFVESIEFELIRINHVIDSFTFKPQVKTKEMKLK